MGEGNIIWIDLESTPGLLCWVIRDIQGNWAAVIPVIPSLILDQALSTAS